MLDNIGGYAVDKVKFAWELTPEEAVERKHEFEGCFDSYRGPQGGRSYNVVSVKRGEVYGTYLYIFDVWGEAAQWADGLEFGTWYSRLDRVDLKKAMPITDDGLNNLYGYLQERVKGKRKVVYQDSPVRQKRGNRDSGGHSLAIGSHTSDWRVHWTQRGSEDGYQEFQVQHDGLTDYKNVAGYSLANMWDAPTILTWEGLCQGILVSAQVTLHDVTSLWDWEVVPILSGRTDVHGIIEQKLAAIENDINRLPRSALFALFDTLNDRLFGPSPEEVSMPNDLDTSLTSEEMEPEDDGNDDDEDGLAPAQVQ